MIKCSKFMEDKQIRQPIEFHNGLNTILGVGGNTNSIGKSTLLMIIDFCFGGDDYIDKETNSINHVGQHSIEFEFLWNGSSYYFKRNTSERNFVYICDKDFNEVNKITIYRFRDMLLEMCEINQPDLTFRASVSRFFRIYNRNTHNELRPLNATVREDDKSGIVSLLKLYGLYEPIKKYDQETNDALFSKITFDNARKLNLGNIAQDENEFESNEMEISLLKSELAELIHDNTNGTNDKELIEASEKAHIINERRKLRYERKVLSEQINDIDFDREHDCLQLAKNLNKLKEFFPNETFETIEKVETFHSEVKSILKAEFKDNNEKTEEILSLLDKQIEELTCELDNYKSAPTVPQAVLDRHSEITKRLDVLTESNSNFQKRKEINATYKTLSESLDTIVKKQTNVLENSINSEMYRLNSAFVDEKTAPYLSINSLLNYSFLTPEDNGTGTRFKAVVLFDLSVLKQTNIPAVIHDTIMFSGISPQNREILFKMYSNDYKDKQIFISFDNPDRENADAKRILEETSVIKLSSGSKALFGSQWIKK